MNEYERLYIQIPLPGEEWERYIQWLEESEQQREKENQDNDRGVIITNI